MKTQLTLCVLLLFVLAGCGPQTAPVTVTAVPDPPQGWMADGWGEVKYTFKSNAGVPAKIVGWSCHWEAAGELVGDPWSDEDEVALPAHKTTEVRKLGHLPLDVLEKAGPAKPEWIGTFTVQVGDKESEVPFRVAVPEAKLPEPLKLMKGEHVGMALMESRYPTFTAKDQMVRWLDECYEAMADLTGRQPYGGDMIIIQESPPHPWYAYAGNPVVMDTTYVPDLIQEVNAGGMPFGWIHEMGHDFDDGIGKWYIWNGDSCEWQANWKLDYAYETIPDQNFTAKWSPNPKVVYPAPAKDTKVSGYQLMQSFFLFFGDGYLADHSRTWDTMLSDDLHSFFLRLAREYGWEPFKKWYRTYSRFENLGYEPPETPEDKINLIAAILQYHVDSEWYPAYVRSKQPASEAAAAPEEKKTIVDILPAFERWRMPVTADKVAEMYKRYPIAQENAAKPASPEAAAALIKVSIRNKQADGWMRKGWGQLEFTLKNEGELPCQMVYWKADWIVDGEPFVPADADEDYESWHDDQVRYLAPGEDVVFPKTGWLDPDMLDKVAPNTPLLRGTIKLKTADLEFELPWEFEVPEAVLKEKLVRVEGKHMAYEITERHYNMLGEENAQRLLRWLDQAYEAMSELTGYTPYDGKIITIIESPPHPWYAYAGNPIIMDTTYMDKLIEDVNKGIMQFGWIHELGHDFDIAEGLYDDWYDSLEAQANLKLVYAYEAMPDQDWKAPWSSGIYTPLKDKMLLDGKDCMDRQFLFNLDTYLADPTIPWERRFCQHTFMQRIARVYGWDPVKKWYRTYKILDDEGYEPPATREGKMQLIAAIMCEATGVDLVPLFQAWRAPVTKESIEAIKAKYPVEEAVKSIVLPEPENN
jgi:hypothetical protein